MTKTMAESSAIYCHTRVAQILLPSFVFVRRDCPLQHHTLIINI
jgi:hypothetical protein